MHLHARHTRKKKKTTAGMGVPVKERGWQGFWHMLGYGRDSGPFAATTASHKQPSWIARLFGFGGKKSSSGGGGGGSSFWSRLWPFGKRQPTMMERVKDSAAAAGAAATAA